MRICLNMIVKNESQIIQRVLNSVVGFADEYCICDTGSTDDTVQLIEQFEGLKGRIYQEPFVNFEVSRTNALIEAQKTDADYILLMDADMVLQVEPKFDKASLVAPVYTLFQETGNGLKYANVRLVRGDVKNCRYIGVTHEYFDSAGFPTGEIKSGISIRDIGDGGCKSDKFERDICLLLKGLVDNPKNERYMFYLANSYFDIQQFDNAIQCYTKRVEMGGWDEEVYFSLYRLTLCYKGLKMEDEFLNTALKAWRYRPTRAESVYEAMLFYQEKQNHKMVVAVYTLIKDLPVSEDKLFVSTHIYLYQMHFIHSLSAFFAGIKSLPYYDKLFNTNELNLNNQFNNYRFYYPVPIGVSVNFTATHMLDGEEYYTSTPSILALGDKYLLNVRLVNYKINDFGGYIMKGKEISSKNKMLLLDSSLKVLQKTSFPESDVVARSLKDSDYSYLGIEDLKLAFIEKKIHFTGTICLASQQIGTCVGKYDEQKLQTLELEPFGQCEKNWVFLPNQMRMIYQWYPLRFGTLVGNELSLTETRAMPKLFEMARGSTNGVAFYDEYWFVVHFVFHKENELRFYTHALVVFDTSMKLKRYTLPFKFTRPSSIEYCLGIVVEKERILMSYSVMDRETYVGIYSLDAFEWTTSSV